MVLRDFTAIAVEGMAASWGRLSPWIDTNGWRRVSFAFAKDAADIEPRCGRAIVMPAAKDQTADCYLQPGCPHIHGCGICVGCILTVVSAVTFWSGHQAAAFLVCTLLGSTIINHDSLPAKRKSRASYKPQS